MSTIVMGRPDHLVPDFGWTDAKKFPQYVYSTNANGCLVHKVARMRFHWYDYHMNHLVRLDSPRIVVFETVCGQSKFLHRAKTCEIPREDAVLCGRCHGQPATFGGKNRGNYELRKEAHRHLGCLVGVE